MELKYYSTEQLKSELKRRGEIAKAQKAEELKTALICRNCKHWTPHPQGYNFYCCAVRTCVGRTKSGTNS